MEKWFFYENGMRKGPISSRSLASVIRYGALNKDSLLLRLGDSENVKLSETSFAPLVAAGRQVFKAGAPKTGVRGFFQGLALLLKRPRQHLLHVLAQKYRRYQIEVWRKYYGEFDETDCSAATVRIEGTETGHLAGEFLVWLGAVTSASSSVLFAGDSRQGAAQMAKALGIGRHSTTGLLDVDHTWDFNDPIPVDVPMADAIISLSMLEHILAPFNHVRDLVSRLTPGGHLMIYTCLPGFDYHRYPIDTLRFHMDWFEEVADKLELTLVRKRISGHGIYVLFKR